MSSLPYLDLTLPSIAANLAVDEALLLEAEAGRGGELLRLWEWQQPAVVLGSGCKLAEDVNEAACRAEGVTIWRRSSGGGTVLLASGCQCYSLVLSYERAAALREIRPSYRHVLERIRGALEGLLPEIEYAGISDLASAGRKFSGNAQQRKQKFLLHHGTLLYHFDVSLVDRYLRLPTRQPDYRLQRGHEEFLVNLPVKSSELKRRLLAGWNATAENPAWPQQRVAELVKQKYGQGKWNRRR
jgi:lipoate-protein ligase A